jgi:hypothetical protein
LIFLSRSVAKGYDNVSGVSDWFELVLSVSPSELSRITARVLITQVSHGKDVNPADEVINQGINKQFLNMSLSVLFGSDHSSLNEGGDLDHSPGDSLSTSINRLQQESVGLTNHVIELIPAQSNDDQSVVMIQELRNQRRRLWDQIEELERTCSPMHATTSSAVAIDPMDNPNAFIPPLPRLLHYQHVPYRMHRVNKVIYEPIFARFVCPHKAEPTNEVASETGVPLRTLYNWRRHYCINA